MKNLAMTQKEFLDRMLKNFGNEYDFSQTIYVRSSDRVVVRCPRHGLFNPSAISLLTGRGCRECGRQKSSSKQRSSLPKRIEQFRLVHGDQYDYSKVVEVPNNRTKIEIGCSIHGSFWQNSNQHQSGTGCPKCWKELYYRTTSQFIAKSKSLYGDRFLYSNTVYRNARTTVTLTCRVHGDFQVLPNNHVKGQGGCKDCLPTYIEVARQTGVEEIRDRIIRDYKHPLDWKRTVIDPSAKNESTFHCPNHGSFRCPAAYLYRGGGCRGCIGSSKGQSEVQTFLSTLGLVIENDTRKIISPYEIDIFLPEQTLGVEFCGLYWHSELHHERNYHRDKYRLAKTNGIRLITLFEDEWRDKPAIIQSMLSARVGRSSNHVNARACSVRELDPEVRRSFFKANHLQGDVNASISYGLVHQNQIVAAISFGRGRYNTEQWEIYRFAALLNTNVRGGLGKLFSHFRKKHNPVSIRTYADLRFGEGKGYERVGFTRLLDSVPGYQYITPDRLRRDSRQKYQKHKLVKQGFDPSKTETKIMQERGFLKIWDCGNGVYQWTS